MTTIISLVSFTHCPKHGLFLQVADILMSLLMLLYVVAGVVVVGGVVVAVVVHIVLK